MFCGSGKSRIMVETVISQNEDLSVLVFPNLALIYQFYNDYLSTKVCPNELLKHIMLNVSSEIIPNIETTTEPTKILQFINSPDQKIICVTYQSLDTLLDNMGDTKIDICIFDEAHRTTSSEYKKLIYDEPYKSKYQKQVFFTATPVNKNGVTMFDRDYNTEGIYGDCGELAYEYTYLQGVRDDILKLFDIRIDMYTENTTGSIYETISRAILTTGNNRVLTFHADVSEDSKSDTSVKRFVDDKLFRVAFNKIIQTEFPDKKGIYKKITLRGLTGKDKDKNDVLNRFENTKGNEIFILASCATIGEGVDTKTANMCVFVDPKTSYINIMQNAGRIVRLMGGLQNATVLIPVYVDTNKYVDCGDDAEKRDLVIREELVNGNYNGIANVCAALKEEDPELYDIMVRYPSNFTPNERANAIKDQRCRVDYSEDNCKDEYEVNEMIEEGEPIEIHTSNVEEPIIRRNMVHDSDREIQRLFQVEEENDDGDLETVYYPIVSENGKRIGELCPPKKQGRPRLDFHTNDEIKMLWSIKGGEDIGNNMCSQVIECQVERVDSVGRWNEMLSKATEYMDKYKKRPSQRDEDTTTRYLGRWLCNQKRNYNKTKGVMKNDEVRKIWEGVLVEFHIYLQDHSSHEKWIRTNDEACRYMEKHGKKPSVSEPNKRTIYLSQWIDRQKICYNEDIEKSVGVMLQTPEIHSRWEDTLTKYNHCLWSDVEKWNYLCKEMVDYMDANKECPSDDIIKGITSWIGSQKMNYDPDINKCKGVMKDAVVYTRWTEVRKIYVQYIGDKYDLWMHKNTNVCKWIDDHKLQRPNSHAKNQIEKDYATWITRQTLAYHIEISKCKSDLMKNPEIHSTWTETLSQYPCLLSGAAKWWVSADNWSKFIDKHNKKPSSKSKDKQEASLGEWYNTQQKSYNVNRTLCKGIMKKDENIHSQWTKMLEKYKGIGTQPKKKSMKLVTTEPKPETSTERQTRVKTELSVLHQRYKTLKSVNLHKDFVANPDLWKQYHAISEQNEETFPDDEIPRNVIIATLDRIKSNRTRRIVDMGCGKAQISQHFKDDPRFTFTNYDHIAFDETIVTSCDISKTPIDDNSVDVVILSLAMWGSNCHSYITEAYRILENSGTLYIIEPTKRWSVMDGHNITPGTAASKLRTVITDNGFSVVKENIEKFCMFRCIK
jgi:superfamily II DNA or RNA helicase